MSNRAKATEWFISHLKVLDPDSPNIEMYETFFKSLKDKEFDALMKRLESGETVLPYYQSNLSKSPLTVKKILKLGDKLGIDFFQRLYMTDPVTGARYLTPHKYMIVDLPVRRQQEHVMKKKSVATHSKFTDTWTGQAMGVSATSKISLPELMILESSGHVKAIEELIKVRGGDPIAFRESRQRLINQGRYNLKEIEDLNSRPTSTETLGTLLKSMHIDNNV